MIGSILGTVVTLAGVHAGAWMVQRWQLGPRASIAIGWAMGMLFALVVAAVGLSAGGEQ